MEKDVVQRLVYSFVKFLQEQLRNHDNSLSEEGIESVEVALQCLETAYGISSADGSLAVSRSLIDVFRDVVDSDIKAGRIAAAEASLPVEVTVVSEEDKAEAEWLKNEGNTLMRDEKFTEAVNAYTKAIDKNSQNAVYYCNRAAAYSKLNSHYEAISDCKKALEIEPQYSKAYGRMGLAYSNLRDHAKAKECYQNAVRLEPDNESYQSNLVIADEKLRTEGSSAAAAGASSPLFSGLGGLLGAGGSGGPDISAIFQNPALINMATQMLSNPNMQNMLGSFLNNATAGSTGGAGGAGGAGAAAGNGGLDALLTAGRQLAEQMQAQNPELVEQLRAQMNRNNDSSGSGGGNNPPNS